MSTDRTLFSSLAVGAVLAVPPALLVWFLLAYPEIDLRLPAPGAHFYVVTIITLLASILSAVVLLTAVRLRDARAMFMALGFLCIAGLFLVHALTTPGVLVGPNPWVSLSSMLALWLGAAMMAASSLTLGKRIEDHVYRLARPLLVGAVVALLAYGATALATSPALEAELALSTATAADDGYGVSAPRGHTGSGPAAHDHGYGEAYGTSTGGSEPGESPVVAAAEFLEHHQSLALAGTGISLLLLLVALLRYWHGYRLSRSASHAATLFGLIFMAEALLSMSLGEVWRLSWWGYHGLLLLSFGVMMSPTLVAWVRGGSLTNAMERLFVRELVAQLQAGHAEATRALVAALEARDHYTRGHSERVAKYAVRLGLAMGLSPERLRRLSQASLLHDIGKLGIPDAVLNKPGPLDEAEWAQIRQHPDVGAAMLLTLPSLQEEQHILRHHHERLDGSGYPSGLKGEAIPLESRIIAVADVFDALTSDRAYRQAWSHDVALAYLQANAGTHLDPACVKAFLQEMGAPAPGQPVVEAALVGSR